MTDISLCFEVHQPVRLKKSFFWDGYPLRSLKAKDLNDHYFDHGENRRIFERVSSKCYLPANRTIQEEIERFSETKRPLKAAYSLSGIFMEQCERYCPQVLSSFVDLVDTDHVEVMEQTYYHSLTSLYEDPSEFFEQVEMHRELVWDTFGVRPVTFENTELLYNDGIARMVEKMGYRAVFTEGIVADPNYVYTPKGCQDLALLLRNYKLTDDVGFRFSSRWWEEYPLTADKYASWLAATPGQCINIFCDYETFGEHQWTDTGIFEFLRYLPREVLRWDHLRFATPGEIAERHASVGEVGVEETVSWADLERDTSCWLGNALQWACYTYHRRLESPAREDEDLLKVWRTMGLSDHLYYIFTHGGGPGEVHSYFSPYGSPYDAAVTYFSALSDLHYRMKEQLALAEDPFYFSTGPGEFTGDVAWGLKGLLKVLERVSARSLRFHVENGDLSAWAKYSLHDEDLGRALMGLGGLEGKELRERLVAEVRSSIQEGSRV